MPNRIATLLLILAASIVLSGCPALTGNDKFIIKKAEIESVEVQILESFPVQVHLVVHGHTGDGCTEIYQITKQRQSYAFSIEILTRRPADAICIQILKSFEETIALDVYGLEAGTYTVNVNGTIETFKLDTDNAPPSFR